MVRNWNKLCSAVSKNHYIEQDSKLNIWNKIRAVCWIKILSFEMGNIVKQVKPSIESICFYYNRVNWNPNLDVACLMNITSYKGKHFLLTFFAQWNIQYSNTWQHRLLYVVFLFAMFDWKYLLLCNMYPSYHYGDFLRENWSNQG